MKFLQRKRITHFVCTREIRCQGKSEQLWVKPIILSLGKAEYIKHSEQIFKVYVTFHHNPEDLKQTMN